MKLKQKVSNILIWSRKNGC